MTDVKSYAAMTKGEPNPGQEHLGYRVLVPLVARPFYKLALGRVGSWNPANFGLLVADSLFVAGTATLVILVGIKQIGSYPASLVAALLYMLNFSVSNLRLAGLVDAGEGFFFLAIFCSLSERKIWPLPGILVLGALTKESFVPLSFSFLLAWLILTWKDKGWPKGNFIWITASWIACLLAMIALQSSIKGQFVNPLAFATSLHKNNEYVRHFALSLADRNLWYGFGWLLPLAVPRLGTIAKSWRAPTAAAVVMVFILDGYYGGEAGTVGRALFSVAGPMLSLSSAVFLLDLM